MPRGPHGVPDAVDLGLQLTGDHDSISPVSIEPSNRLDFAVKPPPGMCRSLVVPRSDGSFGRDGTGMTASSPRTTGPIRAESKTGLPLRLTGSRPDVGAGAHPAPMRLDVAADSMDSATHGIASAPSSSRLTLSAENKRAAGHDVCRRPSDPLQALRNRTPRRGALSEHPGHANGASGDRGHSLDSPLEAAQRPAAKVHPGPSDAASHDRHRQIRPPPSRV